MGFLLQSGLAHYVAENIGDRLAVVNAATGEITQRFSTDHYPYGVALTCFGGSVCESNQHSNVVSIAGRPRMTSLSLLSTIEHANRARIERGKFRNIHVHCGATDLSSGALDPRRP